MMSRRQTGWGCLGLLLFSCSFVFFVDGSSGAEPTYWQDVRPVLRGTCFACHNHRSVKDPDVSGGLALDSYEAALKVVKAHDGAASPLVQRLTTPDTEKRMPLGADPLPAERIALVRRWIDSGAREGQRPEEATVTAAPASRARVRKLEVKLPTTAVPPKGVLGNGASG